MLDGSSMRGGAGGEGGAGGAAGVGGASVTGAGTASATPIGALGAAIGSGFATGRGACCRTTGWRGTGLGGGWTGGGGSLASGAGGVMNSASTCAGITISAALRSRPVCSAQRATAWKSTTDRMMTALRLRPGAGANLSDEDIGRGCKDLGGVVPLSRGPIGNYLRKIHQAEPTTNIRLPARVESNGMWSFPRGCWQAG